VRTDAARRVPPYFDRLIEAHSRGEIGRYVHLGCWDGPGIPDHDFEAAQQRLDRVHRTLSELADAQAVLDVGCGFGGTLGAIDAEHEGMRLAGLNIDHRQLAICRGIVPSSGNTLSWVQGDACALPFEGASFDRVLCVEAMFHFRSRLAFFAEAARVLKAGGALVCSDILLSHAPGATKLPRALIASALRDGYGPWPDPWGEEGMHAEMASACGLEAERIVDVTEETAPSHRFTAPPLPDSLSHVLADGTPPGLRAALVLQWLHTHGGLRYRCFRFKRRRERPR
jgi:MPBQ/MSBQ methyltransferase